MLGMFPQTWALPKVGKVQAEHFFSWRKATGKGYPLHHPPPNWPIFKFHAYFNLRLKSKSLLSAPPILSKSRSRMSQSSVLSHVKHKNAHGLGPSTFHALPLLEHLHRCSVYAILHSKIGWRKVKTRRFGSRKWFWAQHNIIQFQFAFLCICTKRV